MQIIASSWCKCASMPGMYSIGHCWQIMIQQLNSILSKPHGFPQIPVPRKECRIKTFEPKKRNSQYVMCPEQDCESLVYFSDQNHSMIETLGLHQHPFWEERVKAFYKWFNKSASRSSKDAWTREEGKDTSKCQVLEALPGGISQFQRIQLTVLIQRRRQFHGETLEISTQATASSIRTVKPIKNAQFQSMTTLRRMRIL